MKIKIYFTLHHQQHSGAEAFQSSTQYYASNGARGGSQRLGGGMTDAANNIRVFNDPFDNVFPNLFDDSDLE